MPKLKLQARHKLLCGDSRKEEDVRHVMEGERADLCFTSPPYNSVGTPSNRVYDGQDPDAEHSDWDLLMLEVFSAIDEAMAHEGQILVNLGPTHKEGRVIRYWDGWVRWMDDVRSWRLFGEYVWDKGGCTPTKNWGRLRSVHEYILHLNQTARLPNEWVPNKTAGEQNSRIEQKAHGYQNLEGAWETSEFRRDDSVWRIPRALDSSNGGHPAPMPVALPAQAMRSWAGLVFEPFAGSGTTIIAAAVEGCRCFAIEISPRYCDITVTRWEQASGQMPILIRDGKVVSVDR